MSGETKYARTSEEQAEYEAALAEAAEVDSDDEGMDGNEVTKEFIFLIDRSGSMYHTIVLAR